jgi:hypothetical protein
MTNPCRPPRRSRLDGFAEFLNQGKTARAFGFMQQVNAWGHRRIDYRRTPRLACWDMAVVAAIPNPAHSPEGRRALQLITAAVSVPVLTSGYRRLMLSVSDDFADAARATVRHLIECEGIDAQVIDSGQSPKSVG